VSGGNGGLVTGGVGGWTIPKVNKEATDDNNYSESESAGEPREGGKGRATHTLFSVM
jgi:hypothetical protein